MDKHAHDAALQRLEVAELYLEMGKFDKAARYMRQAAEMYQQLGLEERALNLFGKAAQLDGQPTREAAAELLKDDGTNLAARAYYRYGVFTGPMPECVGRGALPLPPPAALGDVHLPPPLLFIDPQRLSAIRTQIIEPPDIPYTRSPRVGL